MKKMQREEEADLKANGIDELLELLPPLPRKWTKQNSTPVRQTSSLPISMQLKANPELMQPAPLPRSARAKNKKPISLHSPPNLDISVLEMANKNLPQAPKVKFFHSSVPIIF